MNTKFRCSALCLALMTVGCGASGDGSSAVLEFRLERDLLENFEQDTGFLPAQSPAALRIRATASADFSAAADASADGGEMSPVAQTGQLTVGASFLLEVSARVDALGFDYEGVVDEFSYDVEPATVAFDPFLLGEEVAVTSSLPAAELARVPVPSIPGSTLIVAITGGQLETRYSGVCAVARDGAGQYVASTVTDGTISLSGTIEIEVPLLGGETFGPFEIDVPVPATTQALDFGSLSLDTGMPLEGASPCDDAGEDTDAGPGTTSEASTSSSGSAGETGSSTGPTMGQTTVATTDASTTSSVGSTSDTDDDDACDAPSDCSTGESCVAGHCVPRETACENLVDDDGNGFVDCEDPNCAMSPACSCTPGHCDTCGDASACQACVQMPAGECGPEVTACFDDEACTELVACLYDCVEGDAACENACFAPVSGDSLVLWNNAVQCVGDGCGI